MFKGGNHRLRHAASFFLPSPNRKPNELSAGIWYFFSMKKNTSVSRRDFLQFMGASAVTLSLAGSAGYLLQACSRIATSPGDKIFPQHPFTALAPSAEDTVRLAQGLRQNFVAIWGDELKEGVRFGYNNDFLAFFPLDGNKKDGLLCVNHETPHNVFVSNWVDPSVPKTKAQVEQEMECTGVSIVHIREGKTGEWSVVKGSSYNRPVNGKSKIPFVSERAIEGSKVALGTLGNCAGGVTPWGTYLTCEENYGMFYGESVHRDGKKTRLPANEYNWDTHFPQPPEHYGWVVEIVPQTGKAKKLTALGRFSHEGATPVRAKNGIPVVYMGDDANDEFVYKFISASRDNLEKGQLFAADTVNGRWLELSWSKQKILREKFRDQTEVLIRAREAARLLGATPQNRPEDVEICPRTGAIFVALTNNKKRGDLFGQILKIEEKNGDYLATEFKSSTFLAGGTATGFACPDNMAFDLKGNLWVTTDMSGSAMNKDEYAPFMNNGLYFIPMEGENAGKASLVATAPTDAEFTGPTFSPDGRTLFLSVQHPGERSTSATNLTSTWPHGGNSIPRPAVLAISGPLLDTIVGA